MNTGVLSQLVQDVADLNEVTRQQVLNDANSGRASLALDALDDLNLIVNRSSPAWWALQIFLLHLAGRYSEANRTLDRLLGINISEQLTLENCPNQESIQLNWDNSQEGVSVLCATYNHVRFLDMCLAGIISQKGSHPFEILVKDDASTDGTQEILKRWAKKYPLIIKPIFNYENEYRKGVDPLHSLIEKAKYPLIAMCEGDDFWIDENKIQTQATLLSKNKNWAAVTHNHIEMKEFTQEFKIGRTSRINAFLPRDELARTKIVLWTHTIMLRREKLDYPVIDISKGILGDQIITALLGMGGPVFYCGNFIGSAARRNLFSTYTPLSKLEKNKKQIATKLFLLEILKNKKEAKTVRFI